jgi:hypothetical protein
MKQQEDSMEETEVAEAKGEVVERWTKMADLLAAAGFNKSAKKIKVLAERKRKLAVAYENYRYVRPEKINEFNAKLKANSLHKMAGQDGYQEWQTLAFAAVENWEKIPPVDVLEKVKEAKDRKIFDQFEVAFIKEVNNDPIVFGVINGCADKFFIAQWDTDVKIEDILLPTEG